MFRPGPSLFFVAVWWLLCGAVSAQQLRVSDPLWGFDGKKLPGQFNYFSAIITNEGSEIYDDRVTLSPNYRSSPQSQQLYLAPGQQRIVQFVTYIGTYDSFTFSWKGGSSTLPDGTPGPPATVTLVKDDRSSSLGSGIRAFPESRFPTSVAGTSNLHAAVLDHIPRWDPARRTAFMDWVRGGGAVAIGKGIGGDFPSFEGDLADLNPRPDGITHLGSGIVVHLDARANDITPALLRKAGIFEPNDFGSGGNSPAESNIPSHLGKITRPRIGWGQIFFIAFLYVVVIGPVHYIWGRRQKRFLISIGGFLAVVALFSWVFTFIGRRGYGESTRVYSLSVANDLGDGNYDVSQWSSVFVTSGDAYRLFHPGAESSYYTKGDMENSSTRFSVSSGKDGFIDAEIPLFSHVSFLQRARFSAENIQPTVVAWESDDVRLRRLDLQLPQNFPSSAQAWVRYRNRYHALTRNGSKLTLSSGAPLRPQEFLSSDKLDKVNRYSNYDYNYGRGADREGVSREILEKRAFDAAPHLLIAIATSGSNQLASTFRRPHEDDPGRADLFIYAPTPSSFHLGAPFDKTETGFTLFRSTVYPPVPSLPAAGNSSP